MICLAVGDRWQTEEWQLRLEGADEQVCCMRAHTAQSALSQMADTQTDVIILCGSARSQDVLEALEQRPPLEAPWLVGDGYADARLDASLTVERASELPALLSGALRQGRLPKLAQAYLPQLTSLAGSLLHVLDMPPQLRAWIYLPQMLALCVACPRLLDSVSGCLYPLIAARFGMTSACVERRLRLAVESTWNRASMDALERFFGQSIDPQRGKPTNREFLCRMRERLCFDAARLLYARADA